MEGFGGWLLLQPTDAISRAKVAAAGKSARTAFASEDGRLAVWPGLLGVRRGRQLCQALQVNQSLLSLYRSD